MGFNKRIFTASHMGGGGGRGGIVGVRNRTFLDRPTVIEALEWKYRRVMAKLGGYVRTTMQRSMRHRSRPSKPGEAPTSWRREKGGAGALRALTEFGYDKDDHTLVIGPQLITSPTLPLGGKTVPQLLDEGGGAFIRGFGGQKTFAEFKPRPFRQPAADKGITKFRDLLATVPLIQTKGR